MAFKDFNLEGKIVELNKTTPGQQPIKGFMINGKTATLSQLDKIVMQPNFTEKLVRNKSFNNENIEYVETIYINKINRRQRSITIEKNLMYYSFEHRENGNGGWIHKTKKIIVSWTPKMKKCTICHDSGSYDSFFPLPETSKEGYYNKSELNRRASNKMKESSLLKEAKEYVINYILKKTPFVQDNGKALEAIEELKKDGIIYYDNTRLKLTKKGWQSIIKSPPPGESMSYWAKIIIKAEFENIFEQTKFACLVFDELGLFFSHYYRSPLSYEIFIDEVYNYGVSPCQVFEKVYDKLILEKAV
jgi:hypothetical protein